MRGPKRHRLARITTLGVVAVAIGAHAGQAAFPDGDGATPDVDVRVVRLEPAAFRTALPAQAGMSSATARPAREFDPSGGFDWADAGVGAGIGLGAAGLAAGALLTARRALRSNRPAASR